MFLVCSYQDCLNIRYPCSRHTFFTIPRDHRRKIWIKNSGNKNLANISDTATRFFCQEHFHPKYIRRQFHRSTLHKFAEPYKYVPNHNVSSRENNQEISFEDCIEELQDQNNSIFKNAEEKINNDEMIISNEALSNKIAIENRINEYLITPNDEIETQLDYAIQENSETVSEIQAEVNNIDEMLTSNCESDCVNLTDLLENNKSILIVEQVKDLNTISVSPEKEQKQTNSSDYENDKHFALSLVGNFQRLAAHKKAIAKIKILQYLTELEFNVNEFPEKITI